MVKINFWEAINKFPLIVHLAFEDIEGDEDNRYVTLFDDHPEGKGVMMSHDQFWQ